MATSTARMPHQRYHLANGDRVPGVTTILDVIAKPALERWNNKQGLQGIDTSEYLPYVAGAGTLAHSLIERQLTGREQDTIGYGQEQVGMAENALASFNVWAQGKSLETRQMELPLVSETRCYGGTCDWYGTVNGRLNVIDFKTSSAVWPDHCFQVAGYYQLLVEHGHQVDEVRVLALGRDVGARPKEQVLTVPEIEPYFAVFLAALNLYNLIRLTKRGAR